VVGLESSKFNLGEGGRGKSKVKNENEGRIIKDGGCDQ